MPKKVKAGGQARVTLAHFGKILDAMVAQPRQVDVPLLYAPPGVGKTESVEGWINDRNQLAVDGRSRDPRDGNWRCLPLVLSQYDPTELKGFPYVDSKGEFRFSPLHTFPLEGPAVIFFDELGTSNKEVQNVVLRLFSQMELGDYNLPPNVFMVAASNHHSDAGVFVHKLSTAMKTRFVTYFVDVKFEVWKKWAMKNDVDPSIVYFLEHNQEFLIDINPDQDSMPCPRTWVNLSHQMQRMKHLGYRDMRSLYPEMVGRVGGAAAGAYQNYLEIYSKVDVDGILKDGRYPQNIGSQTGDFAVMGAMVGTLKNPDYKVNSGMCKNFIGCVNKMKREYAVCLVGDLMKNTDFLETLRKSLKGTAERKHYESLLTDYVKLLKKDDA